MQNQEDQEIEIDLREIAGLLFSRLWILILSGIAVGVIAGAVTRITYVPMYTSTSELFIVGNTGGFSISSLADLQIGSQLTQDYMELMESRPVIEQMLVSCSAVDMTYEEVLESGMIKLENPNDTRCLKISATTEEPELSKQIVNSLTEIGRKRIAEVMSTREPNIAYEGIDGSLSEGSHFIRNIVLGFMAGAFVAGFILVVTYLMDDTIKSSEDLEKYLGLNTLGTIPLADEHHSSSKSGKKRRQSSSRKTSSNNSSLKK